MKLYHKFYFILLAIAAMALLPACEPEEDAKPDLGPAPTSDDVTFTFEYDSQNPNIVHFTNTTADGFIAKWDFGNGSAADGQEATAAYPLKGDYEVTLTVFTKSGRASNSQIVNIAQTNPEMLNTPELTMLTGGPDQLEGKTWVIDGTRAGHMGVGPVASKSPEWWQAPPLDKAGQGLYDDEYTFKLIDFEFDLENNGDVFVNGAHAGDLGGDPGAGDQLVNYSFPEDLNWSLTDGPNGTRILTISDGATIGFYTGVSTYEVLNLEENELYIRFLDAKDPELAWYQRLIPKGYEPPMEEPEGTKLPIDFDSEEPTFDTFGGNSFAVIDNPDPSGANTSARVGETTHGNEPWGGIATTLEEPLDFSAQPFFKMKVWAPKTGIAKFKVESSADPNNAMEVDVEMTETNAWQELTFDFSSAPSGQFDRIALFFDFGGPEGNTFYFDDIRQSSDAPPLSENVLTGGSSKVWTLKPVAGALKVGPAKGSGEWFAVPEEDIAGGRACWFDDEYIFHADGSYEYNANGDVYAEGYMGVDSDGCIAEGDLPADAAAWGSGTHTFSFTSGDPNFITVTGTGAFIALPKAFNGGEYASAPPTDDASVTYEVLSYENVGGVETLVIAIDISADQSGGAWWTFTLESK